MPKYVIEREVPNAGKLTQQEVQAISQKSCAFSRSLVHRSSGLKVSSPTTRSTASTSRRMKR